MTDGGAGRRAYGYVGPLELLAQVGDGTGGVKIGSAMDARRWLGERTQEERGEPFTFVVGLDGVLRLAARRSEHVVCAGESAVLAAGEIAFGPAGRDVVEVVEVTNQSTGYCPDPDSWGAVASALDKLGLVHPGGFTSTFVFRRCPSCRSINLVKDLDFTCALCEAPLPPAWNITVLGGNACGI